MEEKEKKVAALLRSSYTTDQTAERTEVKPPVDIEKLADRVSKVSKKVDNLKGSTNRKFQRITKEIDIIAEGLDDNNKKVTKLSALIEKQKKESEKDSKNAEKGDNKIITILTNMLDFMKLTFEEDKLTREQQNNFSEEHNLEKERTDKELLEALKGKKGPTAERIKDEKSPGWIEILLAAIRLYNASSSPPHPKKLLGNPFIFSKHRPDKPITPPKYISKLYLCSTFGIM
jgi:tetrahydromethanopterin S-methyltransferase subunit G